MHPILPRHALGLVELGDAAGTNVDRSIGIGMMGETTRLAPKSRLAITGVRAGMSAVRAFLRGLGGIHRPNRSHLNGVSGLPTDLELVALSGASTLRSPLLAKNKPSLRPLMRGSLGGLCRPSGLLEHRAARIHVALADPVSAAGYPPSIPSLELIQGSGAGGAVCR